MLLKWCVGSLPRFYDRAFLYPRRQSKSICNKFQHAFPCKQYLNISFLRRAIQPHYKGLHFGSLLALGVIIVKPHVVKKANLPPTGDINLVCLQWSNASCCTSLQCRFRDAGSSIAIARHTFQMCYHRDINITLPLCIETASLSLWWVSEVTSQKPSTWDRQLCRRWRPSSCTAEQTAASEKKSLTSIMHVFKLRVCSVGCFACRQQTGSPSHTHAHYLQRPCCKSFPFMSRLGGCKDGKSSSYERLFGSIWQNVKSAKKLRFWSSHKATGPNPAPPHRNTPPVLPHQHQLILQWCNGYCITEISQRISVQCLSVYEGARIQRATVATGLQRQILFHYICLTPNYDPSDLSALLFIKLFTDEFKPLPPKGATHTPVFQHVEVWFNFRPIAILVDAKQTTTNYSNNGTKHEKPSPRPGLVLSIVSSCRSVAV